MRRADISVLVLVAVLVPHATYAVSLGASL